MKISIKIHKYLAIITIPFTGTILSCSSKTQLRENQEQLRISHAPKCDISINIDSIQMSAKNGKTHYYDIHWNATGYSDTCYAMRPICVDWFCSEFHKRNNPNAIGPILPSSSMVIKIYSDDSLILLREGYISTSLPHWEKFQQDTIRGIERFVLAKGKVDSVRIAYRIPDSNKQ